MMATNERFDRMVSDWLEATAPARMPERVLDATFERTRGSRQVAGSRVWVGRSTLPRFAPALGVIGVIVVAGALVLGPLVDRRGIGPSPSPATQPSSGLGIFAPVAGRVVYGTDDGLWGIDPAAPTDPTSRVRLSAEGGTPLGWSSHGTSLLLMRGRSPRADLFVLHADGSETKVTERPMTIRGASISPDGSRVVFEAVTPAPGGGCCERFALLAVPSDGGPAKVLVESDTGITEDLSFSPDGTQIAYTAGSGDHGHSVWLMDADGTNAHRILSDATTEGAGHVHGLAWSPLGDRIALGIEGGIYTFATDGSGFARIAGTAGTTCESAQECAVVIPGGAAFPFWSPDGTRIAYTTGCADGAGATRGAGCVLATVDSDGADVRVFSYGRSGPWHPGTSPWIEPTRTPPTPAPAQACDVAPAAPVATARPAPGGVVLGCTRDGARLLIQKDRENLYLLDADGSETQLTEMLSGYGAIPGSGRPIGATISPDGSRIVFAGLTRPPADGRWCHDGALFAVDATGGVPEVLWASHVAQNGIVRNPTFSPDGTRIAFTDGYCDSSHSVWLMNADGTDAHQIVSSDTGPLGGGHVDGLAWSPAGDRIALIFEGATYTFAPDGSGFRQGADAADFCWPGRRC